MDGEGPSKKRVINKQLTKENYEQEDSVVEEGSGSFAKASAQQLKQRCIRRVRRVPTDSIGTGKNPFAGISLTTTKSKPAKEPEAEESKTEEEVEDEGETAVGLSADKPCFPPASSLFTAAETPAVSASGAALQTSLFSSPLSAAPATVSLFPGVTNSVNINLVKTPVAEETEEENPNPPHTADEDSGQKSVATNTGEEEEETVFHQVSTLFQNVEGSWKTVGRGDLKLNVNGTEQGRLLLRQEGTLKLILNARLYPEMNLKAMGEDALSFTCVNAAPGVETKSGEHSILAIRMRGNPGDILQVFMDTVNKYKGKR